MEAGVNSCVLTAVYSVENRKLVGNHVSGLLTCYVGSARLPLTS